MSNGEGQGGQQCLWCAIVSGQIPSTKIFEDQNIFVALDINPANAGHLLVIPKKHYTFLTEMSTQEVAFLFDVAKRFIPVLMQAFEAQGVNILYGAGEAAGQRIPHVNVHVIPRYSNDQVSISWEGKQANPEDLEDVKNKILEVMGGGGKPQQQRPSPAPAQQAPPPQTPTQKPPEKKEEDVPKIPEKRPGYW